MTWDLPLLEDRHIRLSAGLRSIAEGKTYVSNALDALCLHGQPS